MGHSHSQVTAFVTGRLDLRSVDIFDGPLIDAALRLGWKVHGRRRVVMRVHGGYAEDCN